MKFFLIILHLCLAANVFSQTHEDQINRCFYTSTPEVTSLSRFTDFSISNFTGIPQIEILIHEIKVGDFKLPIILKYHAKGIQVSDQASNVGLGWSLDAGGFITRSIRSEPDDYNKDLKISIQDRPLSMSPFSRVGRFWANNYPAIYNFNEKSTDFMNVYNQIAYGKGYNMTTPTGTATDVFDSKFGGPGFNDLEADIFYINCGKLSGQFLFHIITSTNKPPILMASTTPYQNIKIEQAIDSDGWLSSFNIIDESGNKYIFNANERISTFQFKHGFEPYFWPEEIPGTPPAYQEAHYYTENCPMTWYLTRIITAENLNIFFKYEDENFEDYSQGNILAYPDSKYFKKYYSISYAQIKSSSKKRLSAITTPTETIYFGATHTREDMYQLEFTDKKPKAITNISVRNLFDYEIKNFKLNYSYFQSGSDEIPLWGGNRVKVEYPNQFRKRLKIDYIEEVGIGKYEFFYDMRFPLPPRFSPQRDFWGFFNYAQNNNSYLPTFYYYPELQGQEKITLFKYPKDKYETIYGSSNIKVYNGDNKLTNSQTITAGMLTKIKYPTGGSTVYEYEPNSFMLNNEEIEGGGVRIKSIKKYGNDGILPILEKYYVYKLDNGKTSGKLITLPVYAVLQSYGPGTTIAANEDPTLYSASMIPLGTTQGGFVGYTQVAITDKEKAIPNGKIVYNYSCPATTGETNDPEGLYEKPRVYSLYEGKTENMDINKGYDVSPFPPMPIYDWARGLLLNEKYYDSNLKLLKEVGYSYTNYSPEAINIYGFKYDYKLLLGPVGRALFFTKYKDITNVSKVLSKKEEKIYYYNSKLPIVKQRIYNYGPLTNKPIREIITIEDKTITNYFNYDRFPIYNGVGIQNYNIIALIETSCYVNNTVKESTLFRYDNDGKNLLFRGQYSLPSGVKHTQAYYDPEINAIIADSKYQNDFTIEMYFQNKPVHLITKEGLNIVYVWGYNNTYPVVELKNITYDQVRTVLNDITREEIANELGLYKEDYKLFETIRLKYPSVAITIYEYKPSVGVVSMTDPRGIITHYNYDSSGRLAQVYLMENNVKKIIEAHEYNVSQSTPNTKYYCNVTLDNTALGGDGTKVTTPFEVGTALPLPATVYEYNFEGWFDGQTKVTVVPNAPNLNLKAKFSRIHCVDIHLRSYLRANGTGFIMLEANEEVTDSCPVKLYKYSVSDIDHLTTTSTIMIELQDGSSSIEEEYGIIPNGNREVNYALKEAPIWDGRKSQYYNSEGMQEICILKFKDKLEDPIPL